MQGPPREFDQDNVMSIRCHPAVRAEGPGDDDDEDDEVPIGDPDDDDFDDDDDDEDDEDDTLWTERTIDDR